MKRFITLHEEAGDTGGGGGATTLAASLSGGGQTQQAQQTNGGQHSDGSEGGQAPTWDFRSALDDNGKFRPGWDQGLPPELKDQAASLAKYQDPLSLLNGMANAQRLIGQRQQVKPPGPDAKPEELANWRKTLGVPDSADGYKLTKPENLPEGVEWNDAAVKEFAGLAHEMNLTPAQVQKLVEYDLKQKAGMVEGGQARIAEYIEKGKQELTKEWGDKTRDNVAVAVQTAQKLGIDPNDPEIANSPKMLKALYMASQLMREDRLVDSSKAGTGMTGAQQAEDIRLNPNNPWHAAYMGREGKERQMQAAQWMENLRK